MSQTDLAQRDQKVLWHPFTQHGLESEFLPVISAEGAWLTLADGRKILDAISSWYVNLHGHAHPVIVKAISEQAAQLGHVVFAGFTHEPAVKLAETLVGAVQARGTTLSRCFYSDNGSTAVETAMKMAFQFHKNRGVTTRTRFLSLQDAYHGDTVGAMSLSSPQGFHRTFSQLFTDVDFLPVSENGDELEQFFAKHAHQYAALIIEPMVQAVEGMKMHSAEFLKQVDRLCKKYEVLLICDEAFTGFYRTGTCFAFEHANIQPDFLCLAKGFTGGYLPLAVTMTTEEVFLAYRSSDVQQAFLHGHSFTANPIGCAAALASWQLLHEKDTQDAIKRISQQTKEWIARLAQHSNCQQPRSLGTIGAVNLRGVENYYSKVNPKIRAYVLQQGILLRPLGPTLYVIPPYCMSAAEIDLAYGLLEMVMHDIEKFK